MRRHRVVVEIDEDLREGDIEEFSNVLDLRASRAFSPPLDPQTLNIFDSPSRHYIGQPMRFDCVGTARNSFTRAEITMLMDQLLLQKSNCCVLNFQSARDCQLAFLCNLLITEVDKRMLMSQSKINSIKLEYYDVRKYDVVNLLADVGRSSTTKSKRVLRPRIIFNNTLELLKWLQGKYLTLFTNGNGHENLDVKFNFTDTRHRTFEVKLSVMMLFLNKMDSDTKTCLRNYFENIHSRHRVKNLMLTDCLKEVFGGATEWFAWFIFHVPIAKGRGVIIDDLLKLANAAYNGLNASTAGDEEPADPSADLDSLLAFLNEPMGKLEDGGSFNMINTPRAVPNRYPQKDSTSIKYWYLKMDQLVPVVLRHMEEYYDYKYKERIKKICYDLKIMISTKCEQRSQHSNNYIACPDPAPQLYRNYKQAIRQFARLVKDIEISVHGSLMRVYLRAKKNELKSFATLCKMKQLENCQTCLMDTIKVEMKTILAESSVPKLNELGVVQHA